MSTLPHELQSKLEEIVDTECLSSSVISGGCINEAARIDCEDGSSLFVKWNSSERGALLAAELTGLQELKKSQTVQTPEILGFYKGDQTTPQFLVLELLQQGPQSEDALGRSLAQLHRYTSSTFGFRSDNYIGTLPQVNIAEANWGTFFRRYRLEAQGEYGQKRGWLHGALLHRFQSRLSAIEQILNDLDEPPTLLHGDLWSGNVFWSTKGPVLIDPAVYYGNREADIAFTEFFGGFSSEFYRSYNAEYPLARGYEERRDIYNLYHAMTHANMFGGSYISQFKNMIEKLGTVPI